MARLFFLLTPFSYLEVFDVRFILLQVVIGCILVLKYIFKRGKILFDACFIPLLLVITISFVYASIVGAYESFLSSLVFSFIFYASFVLSFNASKVGLYVIKKLYVYTCIFAALGLFIQWSADYFLNITLFRYVLFGGNRSAFSFIWEDFSFISLFVVSCIPIVYCIYGRFISTLISLFLILASLITSARTGVGAILLFLAFLSFTQYGKSLLTGRITLVQLFFGLVLPVVMFLAVFLLPLLTGREVSASSSGRFDDYVTGLNFLSENLWFGALLDKDYYFQNIAKIPHNLFIHPLVMGGVFYFILFMVFLMLALRAVNKADKEVLHSIYICLLGFQFIPSFFSAYFFAVLLGIALGNSKINKYILRS